MENDFIYPEAENLMFDPMLIWKLPDNKKDKLSEVCESGDYFLEEKIDGAFYQFVKTEHYSYLFGRSKSIKTGLLTEKSANVPHIVEAFDCLPKETILIGEIYVPGGTSKNVTSIMGCLPQEAIKRQKDAPIHYYVHDIIYFDGENLMDKGAEERYNILQNIWNTYNFASFDFLRLTVKVEDNLEEELSRILKAGGEGVVLKKRDYPYVCGKRPAWSCIKVKQMDTIDLVCMGFCEATKEYTGKELETWPYWIIDASSEAACMTDICQYGEEGWIPITKYYFYGWPGAFKIGAYNNDGELIELGTVSSGLTDEIRQDMHDNPDKYIGRVAHFDCMSLDRVNHTLRHPVFKGWRDDKDAKECTIEHEFGV